MTHKKATNIILLGLLLAGGHTAAQTEYKTLAEKFKAHDPLAPLKADEYQLGKNHNANDHITMTEPFVLLDDEQTFRVSPFLKSEQDTLLRMNDLSYKLIKDADAQIKLTVVEMEQLKTLGWEVRGFSGLEGRRNTYPDLSGMVFFHPINNLMVIVYRGTAGNKDGWDTNFDATKMGAHKVQREFCKDLFDEVLELIRTSEQPKQYKRIKKIIRAAQKDEYGLKKAKEIQSKVVSFCKSKELEDELTRDILNAFSMKLELMTNVDKTKSHMVGEVHKGFLKKYLSTKREVLEIIKANVNSLPAAQRAKLKIIFTGHSQAGATGNLALADICGNHGKEIFGPKFDNKKTFNFYGYFLSAARAGDKDYKKWVHEKVGREFIIRQNVEGDPTPVSSGDEKMGELMARIPVIGEILAKRITQYDDTGYLLLDDGHKTWKRARNLYEREGFDINKFEETEDMVRYLASWVVNDEESVPKFIAPKQEKTSFFWSPIKWIRNRVKTARTLNHIRNAIMGDKEAAKKLEGLSDLILTRYAHLHYGHYRPGTGAAFDPEVVGRDLDAMAKRGHKHELKRSGKEAGD